MMANVSKSAVMIFGTSNKFLKKHLIFRWGTETIPIVDDYKYLGAHFKDTFPKLDSWTFHISKKLVGVDIAFNNCSYFLTNKSMPVAWRLTNFNGMVAPMFTYASSIWFPNKTTLTKMKASYTRKLRYTVDCDTAVNLLVMCTFCNVNVLDYWLELNRVTFKYVSMRKDVPGLHRTVFNLLDKSSMGYTRWSHHEKHKDTLTLGPKEKATKTQIADVMQKWKREHYEQVGLASNRLDPDVLETFVLNDRHFLTVDTNGVPIRAKYKPNYTKWLTNDEFTFAIQCLGGGNNLLDPKCICFFCGLHERSWKHISTCFRRIQSLIPDLHMLTFGRTKCKQQVNKFHKLVEYFTPELNDLNGCMVSILEDGTIRTYFVTRTFHNLSSRTLDISTNVIHALEALRMYKEGRVFVVKPQH